MQSNIECAVYAVNMLAYCMLKMSAGILHAKNVRTVPGSDSRFRFQVPVSRFLVVAARFAGESLVVRKQ